jgi:hypothetical protein
MNALLLTMALLGANDQQAQATAPGQVGQPGQAQAGRAFAQEVNGSWQVIYAECEGTPLTMARAMPTITIRDNLVSFSPEAFRGQGNEPGRQPGAQPNQPARQPGAQANQPARQPGAQANQPGQQPGAHGKEAALQHILQHNWRLDFGPNQTVHAMPVARGINPNQPANPNQPGTAPNQGESQRQAGQHQGAQSGVYILGRDYLCLSFGHPGSHFGATGQTPQRGVNQPGQPATTPAQPAAARPGQPAAPTVQHTAGTGMHSSGAFIVILRRQGAGHETNPTR